MPSTSPSGWFFPFPGEEHSSAAPSRQTEASPGCCPRWRGVLGGRVRPAPHHSAPQQKATPRPGGRPLLNRLRLSRWSSSGLQAWPPGPRSLLFHSEQQEASGCACGTSLRDVLSQTSNATTPCPSPQHRARTQRSRFLCRVTTGGPDSRGNSTVSACPRPRHIHVVPVFLPVP